MSEFSIRKMKEILKEQGDKRVSEDAAKELRDILEEHADKVAREAKKLAEQEGLETVREEHIELGLGNVRQAEKKLEEIAA